MGKGRNELLALEGNPSKNFGPAGQTPFSCDNEFFIDSIMMIACSVELNGDGAQEPDLGGGLVEAQRPRLGRTIPSKNPLISTLGGCKSFLYWPLTNIL